MIRSRRSRAVLLSVALTGGTLGEVAERVGGFGVELSRHTLGKYIAALRRLGYLELSGGEGGVKKSGGGGGGRVIHLTERGEALCAYLTGGLRTGAEAPPPGVRGERTAVIFKALVEAGGVASATDLAGATGMKPQLIHQYLYYYRRREIVDWEPPGLFFYPSSKGRGKPTDTTTTTTTTTTAGSPVVCGGSGVSFSGSSSGDMKRTSKNNNKNIMNNMNNNNMMNIGEEGKNEEGVESDIHHINNNHHNNHNHIIIIDENEKGVLRPGRNPGKNGSGSSSGSSSGGYAKPLRHHFDTTPIGTGVGGEGRGASSEAEGGLEAPGNGAAGQPISKTRVTPREPLPRTSGGSSSGNGAGAPTHTPAAHGVGDGGGGGAAGGGGSAGVLRRVGALRRRGAFAVAWFLANRLFLYGTYVFRGTLSEVREEVEGELHSEFSEQELAEGLKELGNVRLAYVVNHVGKLAFYREVGDALLADRQLLEEVVAELAGKARGAA